MSRTASGTSSIGTVHAGSGTPGAIGDVSYDVSGVGSSTPAILSSAPSSSVTTPGATAADSVPAPATILGQAVNERLSGSEVGSASEEDEDEDEEDEDGTEKDDDEPDSEDEEVCHFSLF